MGQDYCHPTKHQQNTQGEFAAFYTSLANFPCKTQLLQLLLLTAQILFFLFLYVYYRCEVRAKNIRSRGLDRAVYDQDYILNYGQSMLDQNQIGEISETESQ